MQVLPEAYGGLAQLVPVEAAVARLRQRSRAMSARSRPLTEAAPEFARGRAAAAGRCAGHAQSGSCTWSTFLAGQGLLMLGQPPVQCLTRDITKEFIALALQHVIMPAACKQQLRYGALALLVTGLDSA